MINPIFIIFILLWESYTRYIKNN